MLPKVAAWLMQMLVFDMWGMELVPVLPNESLKSEVLTLASCLFPRRWEGISRKKLALQLKLLKYKIGQACQCQGDEAF